MSASDHWEKLTPGRSTQIRREWGMARRPAPAPRIDAARRPATAGSDATCPEHGDMWACGCPGCESALRRRDPDAEEGTR